jgi:hypothetical protein
MAATRPRARETTRITVSVVERAVDTMVQMPSAPWIPFPGSAGFGGGT